MTRHKPAQKPEQGKNRERWGVRRRSDIQIQAITQLKQMARLVRQTNGRALEQWLGKENVKHYSPYEFVLRYGRFYKPRPLPWYLERGMPKQCFLNCHRLAKKRFSPWTYVEGFAAFDDIDGHVLVLPHAWLTDKHNLHAFDPTWGFIDEEHPRPKNHPRPYTYQRSVYIGTPLPYELAEQAMAGAPHGSYFYGAFEGRHAFMPFVDKSLEEVWSELRGQSAKTARQHGTGSPALRRSLIRERAGKG